MKKLMKTGFGLAAMLIGMSLPAYSNTVLSFNMSGISSSVDLSGSNMSSATFVQFNQFTETVNGVSTLFPGGFPGTVADLFEMTFNSANSGTSGLAFSNDANSGSTPTGQTLTGGTTPISLYSAVSSLTFTNTSGGGSLAESFHGIASGVTASFLTELGLPAGTTFLITGGISGTCTGACTSGTGTVTSDSITFTALPEPRPVYLLGAGLLALIVIARKRRLTAAA
jgi:hypothetical protein